MVSDEVRGAICMYIATPHGHFSGPRADVRFTMEGCGEKHARDEGTRGTRGTRGRRDEGDEGDEKTNERTNTGQ